MQKILSLAPLMFALLSTTASAAVCVQGPTYDGCMIAVRLEDQRAANKPQDAIPTYSTQGVQGPASQPDSKKGARSANAKSQSKQANAAPAIVQSPDVPTSSAPVAAPAFFNVAVAWNTQGYWISRTGQTPQEALGNAVNDCSNQFGNCVDADLSLGNAKKACFAIYKHDDNLYGGKDLAGNEKRAKEMALASCKRDRQRVCVLQVSSCNDHQ